MAGHAILTPTSIAVILGFSGFFYFVGSSHRGPWAGKYDMGKIAREQTRDIGPEFAAQFTPDVHPALRRNTQN